MEGLAVRSLEIAFDASGAAEAGGRGRVVAIVDVVDGSTSAEAALAAGAAEVLGAAPLGSEAPVALRPKAVATRAAQVALQHGTEVIVVAEPRVGDERERLARVKQILGALEASGAHYQVVPNQGSELASMVDLEGRVVLIVTSSGGVAFDAALAGGAPAACFVTTARLPGISGWDVVRMGVERATALADAHGGKLTVVASSANSSDDCLAAFELARALMAGGFLRP